jgi:murein DD-endopeptidase MepM/ murein hydrolase activator NlpD
MSSPRFAAGLAAAVLLAYQAAPAYAQYSLPRVTLGSDPSPLTEGTVGWLLARPDADARLTGGKAAGEPIHFEEADQGAYKGIVGVPVDVGDSLRVTLFVARGDRTDTVLGAISVRQAGYPRETIAVAPAFARPNKAAAERIQRENARSRQVSRASRDRPRLWEGPFQIPRSSRITSGFGAARVYNGEVRSRHTGTDFAGAVGTPVNAAGRGVVAMVADFYLAGRAVYIDHGAGLLTAYFHLSRVDVTEGDTVAAGQRIGGVGQSGRVTGPHLHWVARYGTISVNPMSLLDLEQGVADSVTKDSLPQTLLRSGQAP